MSTTARTRGRIFPLIFLLVFLAVTVLATVVAAALRQIMVGATPVYSLGVDFAVLAAWLVVCAILAVRFFRWE